MDSALPLTRRTLLAAGGAGAATLLAGGLLARGPAPRATAASLLHPEAAPVRSIFTPHVGSAFTLRGEDGRSARTRLVEVSDLVRGRPGDEDSFALLFHAAAGESLGQAVVRLEHPVASLGIPLLVSPSGTGRRGQDYSVIVNRRYPTQL